MTRPLALALLLCCPALAPAQAYRPSAERPPGLPREFRGAWVAVVHNIDWPSAKGLSAGQQQAELRAILDRMAALRMNAVLLQVRPECDAIHPSSLEPRSQWLSGRMGVSPGYDPLDFCLREARARGIEVHAWFNPFRAQSNQAHPAAANHVTRTQPGLVKRYGSGAWCDPALPATRERALAAVLDVVRRYDIDGVHLDDYFYPYPVGGRPFPDGRTPAQRRASVDQFVSSLYSSVKSAKPWVRVGISPFGIWRPGVPAGIEAGLDAYDDLAADSRKWLRAGWVDYLAPQLYWRIEPRKQSFPALLEWWRQQGERPVWPGIATTRIKSSEDPGRPASEIVNQIELSRRIGRNWVGHIHWSAKGLVQNRGGISSLLAKGPYAEPALVPPMPWLSRSAPPSPAVSAAVEGPLTRVRWQGKDGAVAKWAVQARHGKRWRTACVLPGSAGEAKLGPADGRLPDAVAVVAIDRFGNAGAPAVVSR